MVTHLPPNSEIGILILVCPQVGKLVVACHWSVFSNTEPLSTVCTGFLHLPTMLTNITDTKVPGATENTI